MQALTDVSIEASGPTPLVLTCERQGGNVRFDIASEKESQQPNILYPISKTFSLVALSVESSLERHTSETQFVLQSRLNQEYLGYALNDRRLLTRPMQFPPPENFRFRYQSKHACDYHDVNAPAHVVAADGKQVCDPGHGGKDISLFVRFLKEKDQPFSVEDSWKQQSAAISAIGDYEEDGDDFPYSDDARPPASVLGGSRLDNSIPLGLARKMKQNGDLWKALDLLSEVKYDDAPKVESNPEDVRAVAKLMCIMDMCVYMRDLDREETINLELKPRAAEIRRSFEENRPLSDGTLKAIMNAQTKTDKATEKIQQVAKTMLLEYEPLCNFSTNGTLMRNGPYCGAFYRNHPKEKPFVVLAFKGTGPLKEWVNDLKYWMKDASDSSPLKGRCHMGFFDGIFKDFPGDLSTTKSYRNILPFQMLRNQLWKLERKLTSLPDRLRVQLWFTGHSLGGAYATNCWAGFLADMHFMHTTVRGLVTFGSPRVGNKTYATVAGGQKLFRKSWRFVNGSDVVAKFPTSGNLFPSGDPEDDYYHLDSMVIISSSTIKLGPSELSATSVENKLDGSTTKEGSVMGSFVTITIWTTTGIPYRMARLQTMVHGPD
ncbi:hypothetical protein NXS19_000265 [Fusarium pseudograminearum]|nr:hypothetical protein NXS19_000265 [Fusarium pseudograminearum]